MNNYNHNSSTRFKINNNNNVEFSHNNQVFPNPSNSMKLNISSSNIRPDSNLIRPIPKKVDLSRIIYQQFMEPRQSKPNTMDVNGTISEKYYAMQKMYREAMNSNNIQTINNHNNNNNGINDFSYQNRLGNMPYHDPRILLNQYLSRNNSNACSAIDKQFYINTPAGRMPTQNIPVLSENPNSYIFNKMNHQLSLRHNAMNGVGYMSVNDKSERTGHIKGIHETDATINNIQYFSKASHSDGLVENHFSMSLNGHVNINCKVKDNIEMLSKCERVSRKASKQLLIQNSTEKLTKTLKRTRKCKSIPNEVSQSNNGLDNSHTTCATPSDSSISPVSMVSSRSTITPQSIYPGFNILNNLFTSSMTDKIETSVMGFPNHSISNGDLMDTDKKLPNLKTDCTFQVLPLKKRIKWQMEKNDEDFADECPLLDKSLTKQTDTKINQTNGETIQPEHLVDPQNNNGTNQFYPYEDNFKTFQKTFLPMEKHLDLSDTESDEEIINVDRKYRFSESDHRDFEFIDNNI